MNVKDRVTDKTKQIADLAIQLSNSIDLQNTFPDIFDLGSAKTCIFSDGEMGEPMFRITKGDGSRIEMPIVNAPVALLRHHSRLIKAKSKLVLVHRHWKLV